MNDVRDKIKEVLGKHREINQTDIADYLHVSPSTLTYQLNYSHRFDTHLAEQIFGFFKKHEIYNGTKEENGMVFNLVLELNALIGKEIEILNTQTKSVLEDGEITEEERVKMITRLDDMQADIVLQIENVKRLIRG